MGHVSALSFHITTSSSFWNNVQHKNCGTLKAFFFFFHQSEKRKLKNCDVCVFKQSEHSLTYYMNSMHRLREINLSTGGIQLSASQVGAVLCADSCAWILHAGGGGGCSRLPLSSLSPLLRQLFLAAKKKKPKQSNKLDWQAYFRLEFRKTAQSIKAWLICTEE